MYVLGWEHLKDAELRKFGLIEVSQRFHVDLLIVELPDHLPPTNSHQTSHLGPD